jgi:ribosomal protein S1
MTDTEPAEDLPASRRSGPPDEVRITEHEAMRAFLAGLQRGDIVSGTVAKIVNFGAFVALDGEPAGFSVGVIRIPDLSWSYVDRVSDHVEVGQRVTVEVLDVDNDRQQILLSLNALQENPLVRFADRVGEVISGRVSKLTPIGVFVHVAEGVEGLLPLSGDEILCVGETVAVRIVEVDPHRRRFLLGPAPRSAG